MSKMTNDNVPMNVLVEGPNGYMVDLNAIINMPITGGYSIVSKGSVAYTGGRNNADPRRWTYKFDGATLAGVLELTRADLDVKAAAKYRTACNSEKSPLTRNERQDWRNRAWKVADFVTAPRAPAVDKVAKSVSKLSMDEKAELMRKLQAELAGEAES